MIKLFRLCITALILSALFVSCNTSDPTLEGLGTVTGKIISPNGIGIAGATVQVADNNSFMTRTNVNGAFSLEAPAGTRQLRVYTGSGNIFYSEITSEVTPNSSRNLGAVTLNETGKIGFVRGNYDNIQSIIIDTLGFSADSIQISELFDPSTWTAFDLIFLNCGDYGIGFGVDFTQQQMDAFRANMTNFMQNGGSVYCSDWSIGFLTETCTDTVGYVDIDINNTIYDSEDICFELVGQEEEKTANVVDAELSALIGPTAELNYDLSDWANLYHGSGFSGNILLSDAVTGSTLAFSDEVGNGSVVYTTFHNEANLTADMQQILEWYIYNF